MKKLIFDVDGTLTPSRQQIDSSFSAYLIDYLCSIYDVYLVTGSDRAKTIEQVGLDIYNSSKRVYNCSGSDVYITALVQMCMRKILMSTNLIGNQQES